MMPGAGVPTTGRGDEKRRDGARKRHDGHGRLPSASSFPSTSSFPLAAHFSGTVLWRCLALCLGLLAAAASRPAAAQQSELVTDLSNHLISINSSFAGTDLLLFGAIDDPGDVMVVVHGPPQSVMVRRKGRVAGIWINRKAVEFVDIPGYYAVAANRPLADIAGPGLLARLQIGTDNLRLTPRIRIDPATFTTFRAALIRTKARQGLYSEKAGRVVFLGPKLFRVRFHFPANVPVGIYRAEVYLVRDGQVIAAQSSPLYVRKTGAERDIYDLAHQRPWLYGLTAVLIALAAGWTGAVLFRKA